MNELHDLGSGVSAHWIENTSGDVVGLVERHTCREESMGGFVSLDGTQPPFWTVEAGTPGVWEGLTLQPSILCRVCGHHGYIRDGRWVPA